ncbi:TPA: DNA/RNA helicase domain-containing protein [Streptococcus suis]
MLDYFKKMKRDLRCMVSELDEKVEFKDIPSDELTALNELSAIYVYCSEDKKTFYIGQTNQLLRRHREHQKEKEGDESKYQKYFAGGKVAIFYGDAVSNHLNFIEQSLIKVYKEIVPIYDIEVLNHPSGNSSDLIQEKRESVEIETVRAILSELKARKMLASDLEVQNASLRHLLFRHSPFFELSKEQDSGLKAIIKPLFDKENQVIFEDVRSEIATEKDVFIIRGGAGTGKTVLMNHLIANLLRYNREAKKVRKRLLRVGVCLKRNMVTPISKIFKEYENQLETFGIYIDTWMKIVKQGEATTFDYVIVDEAQRLVQYKNHLFPPEHKHFLQERDQENVLNLLRRNSKKIVLFYDDKQRIRGTDIDPIGAKGAYETDTYPFLATSNIYDKSLSVQYRIKLNARGTDIVKASADDYIAYVKYMLGIDSEGPKSLDFLTEEKQKYFGIVETMEDLKDYVEDKRMKFPNKKSRILAGYSRKGKKNGKTENVWHEIAMPWNSKYEQWASNDSMEDEVGAIHSVQGYELDYIGLIIGKDLVVDEQSQTLIVSRKDYHDARGKSKLNGDELLDYIKQIYYVLLTRGVYGIRVYFEDPNLKTYWEKKTEELITEKIGEKNKKSIASVTAYKDRKSHRSKTALL